MSIPFSFEKSYGANVETSRPVKPVPEEIRESFVEGAATSTDLTTLYNSMTTNADTKRKYDMDNHVRNSRYHPEYIPTATDKLMNDSEQIINQQMMTIGITLAATTSLAIIIFMISSTASSTQ